MVSVEVRLKEWHRHLIWNLNESFSSCTDVRRKSERSTWTFIKSEKAGRKQAGSRQEAGREFINEFSVTFVRHVGENDPVEFLEFRAEGFTSPRYLWNNSHNYTII